MSHMTYIIEELQKDTKRWIDTKTGWNNADFPTGQKLVQVMRDIIAPPGKKKLRKATKITFIKGKPYRKEEFLERCLVIANENLHNQFNITGRKESIDLIRSESENAVKEIIELKAWKSSDTPVYALVELAKNYIILEQEIKDVPESLTIAAPVQYFDSFRKGLQMEQFNKLVHETALELGVSIQIKGIHVTLEEIMNVLGNNALMEGKIDLNIKNILENIKTIDGLHYRNWKCLSFEQT